MSDDQLSLSALNRRAAIAAVRGEADRAGLDAEQLLDSKALYSQVTGLDPDDVAFPRRVAELVREHATAHGLAVGQPAASAAGQDTGPKQWTIEDVNRSTAQECAAAAQQGLLRDLGFAPQRSRR
ncbi:MAG TPA: hypothetical protein VNF47_23145 [Streptosporangiaceae bacterium]|nr:hypothetical protein [Streptosporangiaceae bacterium]